MKSQTPKMVFEASDVADFCATDVATIYTWVKKGEIPYFKTPGGRLRFKRDAVLDFLRRYHFPIPAELSQGRPRVVVIDEDSAMLNQIKRALTRSFDVTTHRDAYDALLAIGDEKPDAVVLDSRLAGAEGAKVVARLRAWEHFKHGRMVVFSSHEEDQKAVIDAGASGFVAKPATEELHNRLRHLLGFR